MKLLQRQVAPHVSGEVILLGCPRRLGKLRYRRARVLTAVGKQLESVRTRSRRRRCSISAGVAGARPRLFDIDDGSEHTKQIETEVESGESSEVVDES